MKKVFPERKEKYTAEEVIELTRPNTSFTDDEWLEVDRIMMDFLEGDNPEEEKEKVMKYACRESLYMIVSGIELEREREEREKASKQP